MGVQFVIGRAGSGKSQSCFRAIIDAMRADPLGEPIYLIVPKQETFTAERELTCASGLGGFCRAKVVSFELLGEDILAECGGSAVPQITELGRQMVIGHLLRKREKQLTHYTSAARQIGLAAELDGTFAELERCGRTVEDLAALLTELESTPTGADVSSLVNKLRDLRLLYEQYTAYLGQDRLDPHRRLTQVLESLEGCKRIQRATVYVDGFLEFGDYERRMLVGLAKVCRQMQIALLLDPGSSVLKDVHQLPDELSLMYRAEDTYRRLWFAFNEAGIAPEKPLILKDITRFQMPALRQIEQYLFAPRLVVCEAAENVELIEAPDRRAEVDAAARHVRKVLDRGLRLREIALLMRNLDDYHELIDASFREHGIPYFVDRRRTAGYHPLLQFARAAMQIALNGWPHDAVMTLLKTELAGLKRDEVDELENYVLLHRIRGSIWESESSWSFRRKLTRRTSDDEPLAAEHAESERIDAMRRSVAERMQPLTKLLSGVEALPVKRIVVELFKLFERFKIRDSLRKWIEQATQFGQLVQRGEHEQVWDELVDLLDQMVDVLGDEPMSPADFVDVLETGLERFDLALTPPTVDQVLIGTVDRTRSPRPQAVILLGMNDSQFPRVPREGSILSDGERRTLRQHQVELDPDSERALLDERLLGYIAMTRASKYLCLARSIADEESRPQSPSPFWARLREQFPSLAPIQVPRESRSLIDCIGTPRQLVTALMSWVRAQHSAVSVSTTGEKSGDESPWPSLYHWLATHECCNDAIDTMRFRAWRALSYGNEARLSPETASAVFRSPLSASVSRIETFAACPFKHFLRYGLTLTEREEEVVTALDLGNACHGILERIVRQMTKSHAGWDALPPEKVNPLIASLSREIGQELRGELMLSSARNQYILGRIQKTIEQAFAAQSAAGGRGKMVPWRAELVFGDHADLDALVLATPAGNELRLRGKIDRVDLVADQAAFAVIDYKYHGDSLSLDWVYHGLSLQLLTYLIVLQRNGRKLADRKLTPVAAFYVQLLRHLEKVKHPDYATAPDDPAFHLKIKPRGIIDWKHRHLIDSEHTAKASEVVQLYVTKEGAIGNKNSSDGCESEEFAAMLRLVERRLGELGDRIVAGGIAVAPYRIAQISPCANCEYRSVCRFDAAVNRYRPLESMKREQVLELALQEAGDGA